VLEGAHAAAPMKGTGMDAFENPENEYSPVIAQLKLMGIARTFRRFLVQRRKVALLPEGCESAAARGLALLILLASM
jgi:hypothetical protein